MDAFLNKMKNCSWDPDKILITSYISILSLTWKDPWHDPGVGWLSSSPGWWWGSDEVAGYMTGGSPGFRLLFCLHIRMKVKKIHLIKTTGP